jgi:hypothetical protein
MPSLRRLFTVVALVEGFYGLAGLLIPASLVEPLLGWNLSADGHWVTKLLGAALLAQALVAWVLRRDPPVAVAQVLASYQIAAVAVDIGSWFVLAERGVFATALARVSVLTAIPLHLALGMALIVAAKRYGNTVQRGEARHA